MTNLQAALGVAQMENLEEFINRKTKNYFRYRELLMEFSKGELLSFRENTKPNYWFYSLVVHKEKSSKELRKIITELQQNGIQTRPIWGLIHEQKPYENAVAYEIEKAKYYSERIINIPCSTQISEEEIDWVVEKIKEIL